MDNNSSSSTTSATPTTSTSTLPSAYSTSCYLPRDHAHVNSELQRWLVMVLYGVTAVVAVGLNLTLVVVRGWWLPRTRFNLRPFLQTLAVGEVLLALTLPLAMLNFLEGEWRLLGGGEHLCRAVQLTSLGATFFVRSMHIVAGIDRLLNFRFRRTWVLGRLTRLFHKRAALVLGAITFLTALYLILPFQTAGLATGEGPPPEKHPFRYCTADCRRWPKLEKDDKDDDRFLSKAFAVINFFASAVTIYAISVPTDLLVMAELRRAETMVVGFIREAARQSSGGQRAETPGTEAAAGPSARAGAEIEPVAGCSGSKCNAGSDNAEILTIKDGTEADKVDNADEGYNTGGKAFGKTKNTEEDIVRIEPTAGPSIGGGDRVVIQRRRSPSTIDYYPIPSSRSSSVRRASKVSQKAAQKQEHQQNALNQRVDSVIKSKRKAYKAATQMIYWLLITDLVLWTPAKIYQLASAFGLIYWCSQLQRNFTVWTYIAAHYLSMLSTVVTPLLQLNMSALLRRSFANCWKDWYECCTGRNWPFSEDPSESTNARIQRQQALEMVNLPRGGGRRRDITAEVDNPAPCK